jgi:hypothetical protein
MDVAMRYILAVIFSTFEFEALERQVKGGCWPGSPDDYLPIKAKYVIQ